MTAPTPQCPADKWGAERAKTQAQLAIARSALDRLARQGFLSAQDALERMEKTT